MDEQKEFNNLLLIGKQIHTLRGISALLSWDQETFMPEDAVISRSDQIELMASLIHKAEISKKFSSALQKLIDIPSGKILAESLNNEQKAALAEWRKNYIDLKKLPNSFVKSFAKLSSKALFEWSQAKKQNDFNKFAPYLEKIVKMCKKKS